MFWFLLGVLVVNSVVVAYCMFGQKLIVYLRKIMLLDEDFLDDPDSDIHESCLQDESSADLMSFTSSDRPDFADNESLNDEDFTDIAHTPVNDQEICAIYLD